MMETIIGSSFLKFIPYSSYHHTYIRRVKINLLEELAFSGRRKPYEFCLCQMWYFNKNTDVWL